MPSRTAQILDRIARGELRLVYVSPERLVKSETRDLLKRANVALLAVDEAHCISQWGHDFRPEYAALGEVQADLGGVQTVAFTATADAATRADILAKAVQPRAGGVRARLRPAQPAPRHAGKGRRPQAGHRISSREHAGQSGIVYCGSRRKTEELAEFLRQNGVKALPYHAGMEGRRARATRMFSCRRTASSWWRRWRSAWASTSPMSASCCTPTCRPISKAITRRSAAPAATGCPPTTLTLYGMGDIRLRRMQIDESESTDEQKRIDRQRLNALVSLCESPRCRRQTLLAYFGETTRACGNCDFCCDGAEVIDGTIAAQKALSAMVRTGERFGTEHLTNVLIGEATEAVGKFGHDCLPTFGVGKEYGKQEWRSIFRQLHGAGIIALDITGYGTWTVTDAGRRVLKGAAKIELRKDTLKPAGAQDRARGRQRHGAGRGRDPALFEALKKRRLELAKEQRVPAYVVFADKSLIDMARLKPTTPSEMSAVHGVGEAKLRQYGEVFLDVIRQHVAEHAGPPI